MGKAQFKLLPGTEPVEVNHDGELAISLGKDRYEKKWKNQTMSWSALVARLKKSIQTKETYEEYMRWGKNKKGKAKQDSVKDVGGFVGGYVANGRRIRGSVSERQIITLDADFLEKGQSLDDLMLEELDVAFVVYSTHKSCKKAPRQRLVIPLTRIVSADEYEAIARKIADKMGMDLFDDKTYEPTRLMYWPSHSFDAKPYFYFNDEEFLDPDTILDEYPDWTDTSFWPYSSRVDSAQKKEMDKAGDPFEKKGVIGAFNIAHPVRELLEDELSEIYTPCASGDRFTYIEGSTSAGVILYEDEGFVYSHHSTDPAAGLCNAFDLMRIHKFGHLDEDADTSKDITKMPSYKAMVEYAQEDKKTKIALAEKRAESVLEDFADAIDEEDDKEWIAKLKVRKDGSILPSVENALLILQYDKHINSIRLNAMSNMLAAPVDSLPWKRDFEYWQNTDTDQLYTWVANHHGVQFPKEIFQMSLTTVANRRRYHPIMDYLEGLPQWDGENRVEKLLIDYFGVTDNSFSRESITKVLVAAITRIYHPGTKFDYMLVLNGPQGIGKSTFFDRLFKGYISDSLTMLDMRDKTGSEKLQGYWVIEVAEMAGMRKADIECVKSFISRTADIYRPAYGRVVENHPRRCVIVGSTNSDTGFLRDISGNRRFWPIRCKEGKKKPWNMTDELVDQIWAEAKELYENGESLLLSPVSDVIALNEQREAVEEDPRMPQIIEYLNTPITKNWYDLELSLRRDFLDQEDRGDEDLIERTTVSNVEIWEECLGKRAQDMERKDTDALTALMMKVKGWERTGKRERIKGYGLQRVYKKIDLDDF